MKAHEFQAMDLIQSPKKFLDFVPPAKLAILGDPISHSLSPEMQNAALLASGIDGQYLRIHVLKEELAASLQALPAAGLIGANITLPHKIAAIKLLDHVDQHALTLGAVNTIAVRSDNSLKGYNTDGPGLVRAIHEEFQANICDLKILILGAGGGAGQAIATQCALEGCKHLVLANRSIEKVEALKQKLIPHFHQGQCTDQLVACGLDETSLARELPGIDLLINTTSVGMKESEEPPLIPEHLLTSHLMVYDTVYTSGTKTQLLTKAEAKGARTANGLSMLLHQGALAFEIWFNRPPSLAAMRRGLGLASAISSN